VPLSADAVLVSYSEPVFIILTWIGCSILTWRLYLLGRFCRSLFASHYSQATKKPVDICLGEECCLFYFINLFIIFAVAMMRHIEHPGSRRLRPLLVRTFFLLFDLVSESIFVFQL
jgi:hypothetical protein